nr:signal recognition particle receptor subunit beta isoform X2 [Arachis hypogaea]
MAGAGRGRGRGQVVCSRPHGDPLPSLCRSIGTKPKPWFCHPAMEELGQWKEQLLHWWSLAEEQLRQVPPVQLYATAAILVFTTLLLLSLRLLKRAKSNTIVLTGLSGAGKTVLFYQLRDGSIHGGTVTSMEPNEETFVLHSETTEKRKTKPVHVVDVPGHSRLRPKLDEYLPQAAGIVFVVDALDFLPNCRSASEYLYDILTKGSIVKKKIPLLILCNKTDKVTAHTKEFIRRQMEKEMICVPDQLTVPAGALLSSPGAVWKDATPCSPGTVSKPRQFARTARFSVGLIAVDRVVSLSSPMSELNWLNHRFNGFLVGLTGPVRF